MKEKKSELLTLLEKNANPRERLSSEEMEDAARLINEAEVNEDDYCWICNMHCYGVEAPKNTIYDTHLCKSHARLVLTTGR